MLNSSQIGKKFVCLLILFACFVCCTAIICYCSGKATARLVDVMYENHLLPIKWLTTIRIYNHANETNLLRITTSTSMIEQERYIKIFKDKYKESNNLLYSYKKSKLDKFEMDQLPELDRAINDYNIVCWQVIKMSAIGKQKEAYNYLKANRSKFEKIQQIIINLENHNQELAFKADKQNDKLLLFCLTLLGILTILILTFSLYFSQSIYSALNSFSYAIRNIHEIEGKIIRLSEIESSLKRKQSNKLYNNIENCTVPDCLQRSYC